MQPCLIYLHVISLAAALPQRRLHTGPTKEMVQPCLIYLHVISLVAHLPARRPAVTRGP